MAPCHVTWCTTLITLQARLQLHAACTFTPQCVALPESQRLPVEARPPCALPPVAVFSLLLVFELLMTMVGGPPEPPALLPLPHMHGHLSGTPGRSHCEGPQDLHSMLSRPQACSSLRPGWPGRGDLQTSMSKQA
jgi:hypothetical protein